MEKWTPTRALVGPAEGLLAPLKPTAVMQIMPSAQLLRYGQRTYTQTNLLIPGKIFITRTKICKPHQKVTTPAVVFRKPRKK